MRDYLAYAKEHIKPKLTDESSQKLVQAYVDMRRIGSGRGQVSAYPRQLESLIRLSEAHAKLRFSETVDVVDVDEAYRYVFRSDPLLISANFENKHSGCSITFLFIFQASSGGS